MSTLPKYLLRLAIFLLLTGAALWYWNYSQPPSSTLSLSWYIFGFFAIVSLLVHLFLLGSESKAPGVFVRRFMLSTTLRLFLFLIIIVTYAFTHKATAVVFIMHFLILYFLFTAFEVATLYGHFRKKTES